MMNNIFSIFDPSSFSLPLNWTSLFLIIMMIPLPYWLISSPSMTLKLKMIQTLLKEMKLSLSSSFSKGLFLLLISLFSFILLMNFMGLMPFFFTPTSHLSISLSMSLPLWMSLMLTGWTSNSNQMFTHLVPLGTPMFLSPFMVMVETISNIIRPMTLSIRLSANMIAGHLLLSIISNNFNPIHLSSIIISFIPEMSLVILEMAVAIIQAYVFSTLFSLYSSEIH